MASETCWLGPRALARRSDANDRSTRSNASSYGMLVSDGPAAQMRAALKRPEKRSAGGGAAERFVMRCLSDVSTARGMSLQTSSRRSFNESSCRALMSLATDGAQRMRPSTGRKPALGERLPPDQ